MKITLGLAQCNHPEKTTYRDAVALVEQWCERASARGVDLLVFPESLMTRYEVEEQCFLEAAQPLGGPFCHDVESAAARFGIGIVYTVNELNPSGGNPYNTVVLVDGTGTRRGVYRKVHLFDTDFTHESDRMSAGDALIDPVESPYGAIGLAICYDLRFPEVARHAALAGAQLMLYPAAWVDGRLKADQWRTLLAARAIENEMFVAGVCRADDGYIAQSCVFGPDGALLASGGAREGLVVAEIDYDAIAQVRAAMPLLDHRRPELYGD